MKIACKGVKIYQIVQFLLNLPIELKPSLAPLVPWCLSFCDPVVTAHLAWYRNHHITQCEALYGQCWDRENENHILHYQHTEADTTSNLET